jgi:phenylacetic acid degradation operon negative regulatory protein
MCDFGCKIAARSDRNVVMNRSQYALYSILDLFLWTYDTLTYPTIYRLFESYESYSYRRGKHHFLNRLVTEGLIEAEAEGKEAKYRITSLGRSTIAPLDPTQYWNRAWDQKWHILTFDLPESRKRDRKLLWQALRARKLGMVQKSVWVWPHNLEPVLQEIIRVEGLPEAFCGFEVSRLFLCSNAEIVASSWPWEEINREHSAALAKIDTATDLMKSATNTVELGRPADIVRRAYNEAFRFDPLLPKELSPADYRGREVYAAFTGTRLELHNRFMDLDDTNKSIPAKSSPHRRLPAAKPPPVAESPSTQASDQGIWLY